MLLMSRIVDFFTKLSDQRERTTVNRAGARVWLAAQPPCNEGGSLERSSIAKQPRWG